MGNRDEVLRFAVGEPDGQRSSTWRLCRPSGKRNEYIARRRFANSLKASLHAEFGPPRRWTLE